MSINNTTRKTAVMHGNGTSVLFPFSFRINDEEDLKVYIKIGENGQYEEKELNTDYKLSNLERDSNNNIISGDIEFPIIIEGEPDQPSPLTSNDSIYAVRKTPKTQEESSEQVSFKSKDMERALDKATMQIQELQEEVDRSYKAPEYQTEIDPADFHTVAENIDNVNITANNIENVNIAAENIESIIEAPQAAEEASQSASNALVSEGKASVWAEGDDEEVEALGGTHSSKVWAEEAQEIKESIVAPSIDTTTNHWFVNGEDTGVSATGPKGDTGEKGEQGPQGQQGEKGETGNTGPSNVLSIGTVTGGQQASATITGTSPAQVLSLVLPKGDKGDTGENGQDGTNGQDGDGIANIAKTGTDGLTDTYTITRDSGATSTFTVTNSQYRPSLFQSFWSDHLLNRVDMLRADTFSWQSGTVYTAGYQELLSEYNNASSTTEVDRGRIVSNITPFGNLVNNNGIISGFTSNTTFASFNAITPTSSFEIVVKCKQDTLTANSSIIYNDTNSLAGITFRVVNASTGQINIWVNNGSSTVINNVNTNATLAANTWTWFKIAWDGTDITVSQSTDGITYTQTYTNTLSTPPAFSGGRQALGGGARESSPFTNGYIDLNECYLNIDSERYWTGCSYPEDVTYKRTPRGYKIADATQEQAILDLYNSTGIALYYILDTTNTRFKLPRTKYGFVGIRDGVGNYVSESLPDHTHLEFGIENGYGDITDSSTPNRRSNGSAGNWEYRIQKTANEPTLGKSSKAKDSSAYQNNAPVQQRATQMYLYFYVGNYTQPAIEQTAGLNTELFNGKVDVSSLVEVPVIIDIQKPTAENNYTGYKVWSDGWCEQSGIQTTATVTFLKPFANTNYYITRTFYNNPKVTSNSQTIVAWVSAVIGINTKQTTSFTGEMETGYRLNTYMWKAEGYIAEE